MFLGMTEQGRYIVRLIITGRIIYGTRNAKHFDNTRFPCRDSNFSVETASWRDEPREEVASDYLHGSGESGPNVSSSWRAPIQIQGQTLSRQEVKDVNELLGTSGPIVPNDNYEVKGASFSPHYSLRRDREPSAKALENIANSKSIRLSEFKTPNDSNDQVHVLALKTENNFYPLPTPKNVC